MKRSGATLILSSGQKTLKPEGHEIHEGSRIRDHKEIKDKKRLKKAKNNK